MQSSTSQSKHRPFVLRFPKSQLCREFFASKPFTGLLFPMIAKNRESVTKRSRFAEAVENTTPFAYTTLHDQLPLLGGQAT